jgi:hypothetical protein
LSVAAGQALVRERVGHRVLSARVSPPVDEPVDKHLHLPEIYGEAFYERGQRMRRCRCRDCGADLEPRRA